MCPGDTDSVFVDFGYDTLEDSVRVGTEAAERCSATFEDAIKLEYEKVYMRMLMMKKKKYAGLLFERVGDDGYVDKKGIENKRRDSAALVRKLMDDVLEELLRTGDAEAALQRLERAVARVYRGKTDIAEMIISKQFSPPYAAGKALPIHAQVVEKMRARNAATAPKPGARVAYVVVAGHKKDPVSARGEDPLHVLKHDVPLDLRWYVEDHLRRPLERILAPVVGQARVDAVFAVDGAARRTRRVRASKTSGIGRFFSAPRARCEGCREPFVDVAGRAQQAKDGLCLGCYKERREAVARRADAAATKAERLATEHADECERCQGALAAACVNTDCDIFYARHESRKRAAETAATCRRLGIPDW